MKVCHLALTLCCSFIPLVAHSSGVQLDRTRVVMGEEKNEAFVEVANFLSTPALVRTTFEDLDGKAVESFMAIPPLYRLDSNKSNRIRIVNVDKLTDKHESVFYVRIVAYPGGEAVENSLRFGIGQRIKLFYRPKQIDYDSQEVAERLRWSYQKGFLKVENPTALSISMTKIQVGEETMKAKMLLPHQSATYQLQQKPLPSHKVLVTYVDEFGSYKQQTSKLEK